MVPCQFVTERHLIIVLVNSTKRGATGGHIAKPSISAEPIWCFCRVRLGRDPDGRSAAPTPRPAKGRDRPG
jgi:hypothetical protein